MPGLPRDLQQVLTAGTADAGARGGSGLLDGLCGWGRNLGSASLLQAGSPASQQVPHSKLAACRACPAITDHRQQNLKPGPASQNLQPRERSHVSDLKALWEPDLQQQHSPSILSSNSVGILAATRELLPGTAGRCTHPVLPNDGRLNFGPSAVTFSAWRDARDARAMVAAFASRGRSTRVRVLHCFWRETE